MSNEMLKYFMIGIGALFAVIVIAFLIIKKKSENSEIAQIRKLREGTKEKKFFIRSYVSKIICILS